MWPMYGGTPRTEISHKSSFALLGECRAPKSPGGFSISVQTTLTRARKPRYVSRYSAAMRTRKSRRPQQANRLRPAVSRRLRAASRLRRVPSRLRRAPESRRLRVKPQRPSKAKRGSSDRSPGRTSSPSPGDRSPRRPPPLRPKSQSPEHPRFRSPALPEGFPCNAVRPALSVAP